MGLIQSKPISTDPKIINKPVLHVWKGNSMQTSVTAGRDSMKQFSYQKYYSLCRFNYVCLSFNYVRLSFNYVFLSFNY